MAGTGLSEAPAPFVTAEDILLATLHWYQAGGEASEVQWRDIQGLFAAAVSTLDREYLKQSAGKLGVLPLLGRALSVV